MQPQGARTHEESQGRIKPTDDHYHIKILKYIKCYNYKLTKMLMKTSKVASSTAMMSALYWGTLFMEGIAALYLGRRKMSNNC